MTGFEIEALKRSGGPAFPVDGLPGMTLRDYFAAKAMQGVFTSPIEATTQGKGYIAKHAYAMADAMLAERAK